MDGLENSSPPKAKRHHERLHHAQDVCMALPSWLLHQLDALGRYSIYLIEFLGTYFLVLTIGFVQVGPDPNLQIIGPLAIGSVLMACVFMGGHISGAHYNPAVTLGVFMTGRGKITLNQSLGYVFSQLLGSLLASLTYWHITERTFHLRPGDNITVGEAVSVEMLFTFLLVSVVLNTATTRSQADNSFYGLAIGFTVLAGASTVGSISGGAFNPAVGFGPIIVDVLQSHSDEAQYMWIYWVGPLLGSMAGAIGFRITNHHKEYRTGDYAAIIAQNDEDVPLT